VPVNNTEYPVRCLTGFILYAYYFEGRLTMGSRLKIDPNWCVIENQFDIKKNRHYESVFSLGTGFMTSRASIDEGFDADPQSLEYERHMDNTTLEKPVERKSHWGTYISIVQANHPNLRTGIVNLPYYLGLIIHVDGERLDMEKCYDQGLLPLVGSTICHPISDDELANHSRCTGGDHMEAVHEST
jgi:hypothetical protein